MMQDVVLLDGGGNLGEKVMHALAITKNYRLWIAKIPKAGNITYSRHCRYVTLHDWSWNNSAEDLHIFFSHLSHAILLPITLKAVHWVVDHQDALRKKWRLPRLPSATILNIASDKLELARLLNHIGIATPPVCAVTQYHLLADKIGAPILLKPKRGEGGKGIQRAENRHDAARQISSLQFPNCFFAQTYISGIDVSHGVFCRNGAIDAAVAYRCLNRKEVFGTFSSIQIVDDAPGFAIVERLMRALKWNGIANIDLRVADDGTIYVLDLNPRFWGNVRSVLVSGLNFPELVCLDINGHASPRLSARTSCYYDLKTSFLMWCRRKISYRESEVRWIIFDPVSSMLQMLYYPQ